MNETSNAPATNAPIKLTEGAIKQIKILYEEKHVPENYGLRVGIKGCLLYTSPSPRDS